jgi:hypothetical protein
MSTSVTASKPPKPAGPAKPALPEEKFWKRYSPHGEAPLSLVGSFALHLLAVGLLVLVSVYLASLLFQSDRSLPIEPVRLQLGGGGGKPGGSGDGKGIGHGAEDVGNNQDNEVLPGEDKIVRRDPLNPIEKNKLNEKFDSTSARYIQESNSESAKAFARLEDSIRRKLSDGLKPGKGKGGTGSGGGKGTGKGTGEGAGTGAGKATLTQREKRMLRWHMRFTANSGAEYLAQLRGLGAILAIPVSDTQYKLVRELRHGAPLLDEDLSNINRIYWIDDKPRSVRDIMLALGHPELNPPRFVAFMPEQLETNLYNMERKYVENVLRRRFNEDDIDETNFKVVPTGGKYKVELLSVNMRGR